MRNARGFNAYIIIIFTKRSPLPLSLSGFQAHVFFF